jgi:L-threonylcarbamoyladenylate synthase
MSWEGRAELLGLETAASFNHAVEVARRLLAQGEVVAVPTETVYGLAANALDESAVAKIYAVKGRPAQNPLIVHVGSLEGAKSLAAEWPAHAAHLASAFWPGPLTIVVKKASAVPSMVTAGGETVAIRWPSHPFMQKLIVACGFPLAAPSANLSTEVSPTNAAHVVKSLGHMIRLVVDGGQSQVGIESTVVDVTGSAPRVLRPGLIHSESIEAVVGVLATAEQGIGPVRSPGLLTKHYSPKARVLIRAWRTEKQLLECLERLGLKPTECYVIAHTHIPLSGTYGGVAVIPHDAEAYARALYSELHRVDDEGLPVILIEDVPLTPEWHGVRDRLLRASAH